jgi:hypothetical protein
MMGGVKRCRERASETVNEGERVRSGCNTAQGRYSTGDAETRRVRSFLVRRSVDEAQRIGDLNITANEGFPTMYHPCETVQKRSRCELNTVLRNCKEGEQGTSR